MMPAAVIMAMARHVVRIVAPERRIDVTLLRRQDRRGLQMRSQMDAPQLGAQGLGRVDPLLQEAGIDGAALERRIQLALGGDEFPPRLAGARRHAIEARLHLSALLRREPELIRELQDMQRAGIAVQLGGLGESPALAVQQIGDIGGR
jgi:hypothetical protein